MISTTGEPDSQLMRTGTLGADRRRKRLDWAKTLSPFAAALAPSRAGLSPTLEGEILSEAPETANAREWELDRKAWNLPRAPRDVEDETGFEALPEDLRELDRGQLRDESDARDARLSVLFRRWPSLSRIELREIRRLNDERQRLARSIGRLRDRTKAERISGAFSE